MHEHGFLFRAKSIGMSKLGGRKPCNLLNACRHILREIQAEVGSSGHINSARSAQNEVLVGIGDASIAADCARQEMLDAGVDIGRMRKDYTQAVEFLFSLHPSHNIAEREYFDACVEWVNTIANGNVLLAVVHRDEGAPHMHVLVLPLLNGRMDAQYFLGRKQLAELSAQFFAKVAQHFGLKRSPKALNGSAKAQAVRMVLDRLALNNDPLQRSPVWVLVRGHIERDPAPFAEALGIELPQPKAKRVKTMAEIFTSTGKGERIEKATPIGIAPSKPIGIADALGKHQSLCSVGIAQTQLSLSSQPTTAETNGSRIEIARTATANAIARQAIPRPTSQPLNPEVVIDGTLVRIRDGDPLPADW